MEYMLDTNICVFIIRKRPKSVLKKLKLCSSNDVCISAITLAELEFGVRKSPTSKKAETALQEFLKPFQIVPFSIDATLKYGEIRHQLEKNGTPIGPLDTLIAAHALSENLMLVTNNLREFSRVDNLSVEDWI